MKLNISIAVNCYARKVGTVQNTGLAAKVQIISIICRYNMGIIHDAMEIQNLSMYKIRRNRKNLKILMCVRVRTFYILLHTYGFPPVLGLVLPNINPKQFVPRSECFMIVSENQIGQFSPDLRVFMVELNFLNKTISFVTIF